MSKPEPEWLLASWVRLVQARWAATGVSRADRRVLLRQLLQDLAAARAGGASINELVATSPAVFADSCAVGLMSRSAGIELLPLLGVCLGTGVASAGVAWFALVAGVQALDNAGARILDAPWFGLSVDLFLALAVLAAMLSAVRWTFRLQLETVMLVPRLGAALATGSLLGFTAASAYGARWAYSVSPEVIGVEILIMLGFLAVATMLAQRWARHRPERTGLGRPQPRPR